MKDIVLNSYPPKLGTGPIAFVADSPFPDCINWPIKLCLRTHFDCLGFAIDSRSAWKCTIYDGSQCFSIKVIGTGVRVYANAASPGMLTDLRSIEMLLDECCPPQLIAEFLGTEGIPD